MSCLQIDLCGPFLNLIYPFKGDQEKWDLFPIRSWSLSHVTATAPKCTTMCLSTPPTEWGFSTQSKFEVVSMWACDGDEVTVVPVVMIVYDIVHAQSWCFLNSGVVGAVSFVKQPPSVVTSPTISQYPLFYVMSFAASQFRSAGLSTSWQCRDGRGGTSVYLIPFLLPFAQWRSMIFKRHTVNLCRVGLIRQCPLPLPVSRGYPSLSHRSLNETKLVAWDEGSQQRELERY